MTAAYEAEPPREVIEGRRGPAVIEFGTNWCGYCQAAQGVIAAAFADHAQIPRIKVEDGKGRPLGRVYGVKFWPTLIFLRDGKEVTRLVRPSDPAEISEALREIA